MAEKPLYLKANNISVVAGRSFLYVGNEDERSVITFTPSLLSLDSSHSDNIFAKLARLYSMVEKKYVRFDVVKKEIKTSDQPLLLEGMCMFEKWG